MQRLSSRLGALAACVLMGCGTPAPTDSTPLAAAQGAGLDTLVNVTLNKPATASVSQDPFRPEYAVDGNITLDDSRWCPGIYNPTRLLDIDLQGTFDLVRMELYTGYRDIRPIKSYELFYDDGTGWKPLPGASQTNNASIEVFTTFSQTVTAKKVRFSCTDTLADNCRLKELWIFGTPHEGQTNIPPVVNAGPDRALTLPVTSVSLAGSATDADGVVSSLLWTQVSGPVATLASTTTATLSVAGLSVGTSVFRLTATDDAGAASFDDVSVTVAPVPDVLTNVALNKPAVAGTSSASYPAPLAVDGSLTTRWESAYAFMTHNYLDVDLQGMHEVSSAELHMSISATSAFAMPAFELQAWNGGCWKTIPGTVVEGNPLTNTLKTLTFTAPVLTDKVRVVCKDKPYCRLRELKLMGKPSALAPTGPTTCAAGQQTVVRNLRYDYALFLPAQYNDDRTTTWPVIIALHGVGGNTLTADHTAVLANPEGLARQFSSASFRAAMKAIVISPNQRMPFVTNGDAWFNNASVLALLDDVKRDYRVDLDRVYLTGLSGGANTGFEMLLASTAEFAAFVPVAITHIYTTNPNLCGLKTLPIWGFQGGLDDPTRLTSIKTKLDTECGPGLSAMRDVTVYPNAGHGTATWDTAYATLPLYDWLLQQRISQRP
ncbi:discoidin domain-containing protein [Myxococcus landrumensis]|uniref:Discoidin domain-containing protein n=1 Tax=Myxococcus landrumensis TaxID=2813577 RepID=A0ABX7N324_9BACT|nr:discoidin domain-containing protein [Myxococcus landrumus]QSQ13115.1 discoidin domain-containing protein [Myxococcus landrumus]